MLRPILQQVARFYFLADKQLPNWIENRLLADKSLRDWYATLPQMDRMLHQQREDVDATQTDPEMVSHLARQYSRTPQMASSPQFQSIQERKSIVNRRSVARQRFAVAAVVLALGAFAGWFVWESAWEAEMASHSIADGAAMSGHAINNTSGQDQSFVNSGLADMRPVVGLLKFTQKSVLAVQTNSQSLLSRASLSNSESQLPVNPSMVGTTVEKVGEVVSSAGEILN